MMEFVNAAYKVNTKLLKKKKERKINQRPKKKFSKFG